MVGWPANGSSVPAARRGEDPHAVIRRRVGGRQQERGLGEIRPLGDPAHGALVDPVAVEHDREGFPR
jgi:hypothetical protein